ncbi:hypothetical protein D3C71_2055920 [compost metagenome]
MSSSVPCAPSNSSGTSAWFRSYSVRDTSATIGLMRSASSMVCSRIASKLTGSTLKYSVSWKL